MSVEYIKRLAGPYVGDGTGQKTFSFGFLIFDESDVYVAVADSSDSEPSDLQQGTDYTVSMNADQSATPGGTITLTSETGLAKDAVLVIGSAVDYTQTLDLTNYTRFPPERITTELDRIVVMIQQIVELLGRVVQVPPTSSISPSDLFFQLLNAAESAAQSAEDAAASLAACEQIRQLIEQYSWDIPHIVDSLRDVENYPYDGLFAVAGFGNAGGKGQNISNRCVKAEGSTELRALGERFADIVNVKDFGAKGDGVTDDTTAIQAAANTGKSLFFPEGDFILTPSSENTGALLLSLSSVYGPGRVEINLPEGIVNIPDLIKINSNSGCSIKISGEYVDYPLTKVSISVSKSEERYLVTVPLSDTSKIIEGSVVALLENETSSESAVCVLNGAYKVVNVNENSLQFYANYHSGAYELNGTNFSGTLRVYKTTLFSGSKVGLFQIFGRGSVHFKDFSCLGCHSYGDEDYQSSIAFKVTSEKNASDTNAVVTENVAISEFGIGISVPSGAIRTKLTSVSNSNFGATIIDNGFLLFENRIVFTCCLRDGLYLDGGGSVVGYSEGVFCGNTKRGIWCNGHSNFFSNFKQNACFNGQAGIYAKSNSTVCVGSGSEASYNYTSNANDCPGFGAEDHSFIMASGSKSAFNGLGYCPGGNSTIDAINSVALNNIDTNYYALVGSVIEAAGAQSNGSQYGFSANEGSTIRCKNAEVLNATNTGVIANRNSAIRCDDINIHNNVLGIKAGYNSDIYAPNATLQNNETDFSPDRNSTAYIGTSLYPSYFVPSEGDIFPIRDNEQRNGIASNRWSNIYAATGSVQTSDSRCKTLVAVASDELLDAWGAVLFHTFQFKDAIQKKGADAARFHVGVIAQEVASAFQAQGLDAARYGLFCYDEWQDEYETVEVVDQEEVLDGEGNVVTPRVTHTEQKLITAAGDRYGIRYEEALCLEAAYQRRRADKLEERLAALEKRMTIVEAQ